jgi:hypothetical protein
VLARALAAAVRRLSNLADLAEREQFRERASFTISLHDCRGPRRVTAASARAVCAALLAFLCFVTVRVTSITALAGDEPHYLVLAQSLLSDNDLKVANNYAKGTTCA